MPDKQRYRTLATDTRPVAELIARSFTLDRDESDEYWDILDILHLRGTREVLEAALSLCHSALAKERLVGVDILMNQGESVRMLRRARAQVANPQSDEQREYYQSIIDQLADVTQQAKEYNDETVAELFRILETEQDTAVMTALVTALGWYTDEPQVIERLAGVVHHPDETVRWALSMAMHEHDPLAIETEVTLSHDESPWVRDWATFHLAQLSNDDGDPVDTPQIRDALAARLHDEEPIVRYEAFRGLVERDDPRVIEPIATEPLEPMVPNDDTDYGTYFEALVEAGKRFADPRLLPALRWLEAHTATWWPYDYDEELAEAIRNCSE